MTARLGKISFSLMLVTIFGLTTSQPAAAERLYCITDLGTFLLNGYLYGETDGRGINNLGQVVGSGDHDISQITVFRTAPNSVINAETDGFNIPGRNNFSEGINDLGQVVATEYNGDGSSVAYRTAPNGSTDLASLGALGQPFVPPGAPAGFLPTNQSAVANAINNLGQVVGGSSYYVPTSYRGPSHAFRTAPNSPINPSTDDLGTLGGITSSATGINYKGEVVGYSSLSSGNTHAFRTASNSPINASTDDLGTLGGITSSATGK